MRFVVVAASAWPNEPSRSHPQLQAGLLGEGRYLESRLRMPRDVCWSSTLERRRSHPGDVQGAFDRRERLKPGLTRFSLQLGAERLAPPIPDDVVLSKAASHFLSNCLSM